MNERWKKILEPVWDFNKPKTQNGEPNSNNGKTEKTENAEKVDAEIEIVTVVHENHEIPSTGPVKYVEVEDKYYNKIGFYCVLDPSGDPPTNLKKALDDLEQETIDRIKQVTELYNQTVKYYNERIADREARLQEERDNLGAHRGSIVALKEERQKLLAETEEIKNKLTAAYDELANQKRGLTHDSLKNRLDEVEKELQQLIKNHQVLAENKYEASKRIYEDNKKVFDLKVERFTRMKNEADQAYQTVRQKIEDLSRTGISQTAVQFLNYVGLLGLVAAGWFYSVFILSTSIDSEDYLSFFLRRIINFGVAQFQSGNILLTLLILTGILLGLLVMVSGVVWLCHWLLEGRGRGNVNNELVFNFNEDGNISFYSRINTRSAFAIWMQLAPYIFVAGLAFILISLFSVGSNPNELSDLLRSLSGQFMGGVLALAATGIMFLYITLIIEPRLLRQDEGLLRRSQWARHWELVTSIALFLLLMIFMVFSGSFKAVEVVGKPAATDVIMASASFLIILLFTAFTLGYGVKYRGLYQEERYLKNYLHNLAHAIEDNSRPTALDLKSLQSKNFRKEFEASQAEFFKIIRKRNELVTELFGDVVNTKTPGRQWRQFFTRNGQAVIVENGKLTPVEEKYFPELKRRIADLESAWHSQKTEAEALRIKIEAIEQRRSDLEETINKKIQAHEAARISLKKNLINREEEFHRQKNSLRLQHKDNACKIQDGYNLGLAFYQKMYGQSRGLIAGVSEMANQIEA